jgi:hypothetical protein
MCNTLFINQLQLAAISVVRSGKTLPFTYTVMPLCHVFLYCKKTSKSLLHTPSGLKLTRYTTLYIPFKL